MVKITIPREAVKRIATKSKNDVYREMMDTGRIELIDLYTFGYINTRIFIKNNPGVDIGVITVWDTVPGGLSIAYRIKRNMAIKIGERPGIMGNFNQESLSAMLDFFNEHFEIQAKGR